MVVSTSLGYIYRFLNWAVQSEDCRLTSDGCFHICCHVHSHLHGENNKWSVAVCTEQSVILR